MCKRRFLSLSDLQTAQPALRLLVQSQLVSDAICESRHPLSAAVDCGCCDRGESHPQTELSLAWEQAEVVDLCVCTRVDGCPCLGWHLPSGCVPQE